MRKYKGCLLMKNFFDETQPEERCSNFWFTDRSAPRRSGRGNPTSAICSIANFRSQALARISHQEPAGLEANARRQGCRGAIHRARLPTYCTLGDVQKLLPRAVAAGPFASSPAGRGEKCGLEQFL